MNYIKIDQYGTIKESNYIPMTAGNVAVNKIYILADFDQEEETPYIFEVTAQRGDGFTFGPVIALEGETPEEFETDYPTRCRVWSLDDMTLAVEGNVEFTVVADEYEEEEKISRLCSVVDSFYCNKTIKNFFNDQAEYDALVAAVVLKDFSTIPGIDTITGAREMLLKEGTTAKTATLDEVITFLKTQNLTQQVVDLDDYTMTPGVYANGTDIVMHSVKTVGTQDIAIQIGIINAELVVRTYEENMGAWVVSSDLYAPAIHNHDDLYYRKDALDTSLGGKVDKVTGSRLVVDGYASSLENDEYLLKTEWGDERIQPLVFSTWLLLKAYLDGLTEEPNIGTKFLIIDRDVPDFWWTGVVADEEGEVWDGYKITILETKIDLTDYYTQGQVNALLTADNITFDGSTVEDALIELYATKADRVVDQILYAQNYINEPQYMVQLFSEVSQGTKSTSVTAGTSNLLFRNYRVFTEELSIAAGALITFNIYIERTSGPANSTGVVEVFVCKFTGDPAIEDDRNNASLYTNIATSLPYTANFGDGIYVHKTMAAVADFELEADDIICFNVQVIPAHTSNYQTVVSATYPAFLAIPETGVEYTSDQVVNKSIVGGASVTDALDNLKDELYSLDPFDSEGTYPLVTVGKAQEIASIAPKIVDEEVDLRVTAEDDLEVRNGLAKALELEGTITTDVDGVLLSVADNVEKIISTGNNWLKLNDELTDTTQGITTEVLSDSTIKINGTVSAGGINVDIGLVASAIIGDYAASGKLYAEVVSGTTNMLIQFTNQADLLGDIGTLGTDTYIDLSNTELNNCVVMLSGSAGETASDLIIRFWTKHASNPDQTFEEFVEDTLDIPVYTDNFIDNVIDLDVGTYSKYWTPITLDGTEENLVYHAVNQFLYDTGTTVPTDVYSDDFKRVTEFSAGFNEVRVLDDIAKGLLFKFEGDLAAFQTYLGTSNMEVWYKVATPTILPMTIPSNTYQAFNYGLEYGLNGNRFKVEYIIDLQTQIYTNAENIANLKAKPSREAFSIAVEDWGELTHDVFAFQATVDLDMTYNAANVISINYDNFAAASVFGIAIAGDSNEAGKVRLTFFAVTTPDAPILGTAINHRMGGS